MSVLSKREALTVLQKLFTPEPIDCLAVVEVLDTLKAVQSSPAESETNVLQYTIDVIFEETKYIIVYPLNPLMKMGRLFGGLIEYDLISNNEDLNAAYDIILDALKNSPSSNVFRFGVMALQQIKHLLYKRREYCLKISTIFHFNEFPSELIQYVKSGINQQKFKKYQVPVPTESPKIVKSTNIITTNIIETDAMTSGPLELKNTDAIASSEVLITNSPCAESTPAATTKPSKNDENTMMEPPTDVTQNISFIFNSINEKNAKEKCAEVKAILKRRYLPWLSVYLTKRIRDEFILHPLYIICLEYFNNDSLKELIKFETVENIKVLFKKYKSLQTKIWLKNLGHWLGLITLAENKPVPFYLNTMVAEACVKGGDELAHTIPFVTKILESCRKSKAYGPKTPWTIFILNRLAELHQTTGLTLNCQLEIEHLFKALNVDLKTMITNSLRASSEPVEVTKPAQNNDEHTMTEPPENVKLKIAFIFNTINQENVKEKCAEVKRYLKRRDLPWFSVYLTQRICDEFQLHSLYFTCLEYFNSDALNDSMEFETVKNIKILFMKEKSHQKKTCLKNLGHWLGLITLAKDKPVPFDLNTMVADAYVQGGDELAYTLPFVVKILESCCKSKVYGLKAPWTKSALSCLAELYKTTGFKLVFQFEIELLFKALNVELKEFAGHE